MYENIRDYPMVMAVVHQSSICKRIISAGIILFCILFIGFSLYGDGMVGLSDNGDFLRVMIPHRIGYTPDGRTPFAFQRYYTLSLEGNTGEEKLWRMLFTLKEPYPTTQNVFIKLSLLANTAYHAITDKNYGEYDIFWLGLLYYLAYVGAIGVIVGTMKSSRLSIRVTGALLLIIVFCDVGYVTYFNSFYGEPLQMVTFLWLVASVMGVLSSQRKKPFYIILFYFCVVFFAGAKYANIPQGMLLSACGLVFLCYFTRRRTLPSKAPEVNRENSKVLFIDEERLKKRSWNYICGMRFLILTLFVFSLLMCRLFYENVPNWMDKHTTYQSVFFGILKDSPSPQADLEALGLPQEYSVLAGTHAYMQDYKLNIQSEEFQRSFYDSVNKFDVLAYYLKNPARLIEKLSLSCQNSVHIRPVYLGNYDRTYERPKFREEVGLWSRVRTYLPFGSLLFTGVVFVLSSAILLNRLLAAVRARRHEPGTFVFLVFASSLLIMNAMNLAIPIMANGEADLAKHMFAFVMGFDLQFVGLSLWVSQWLFNLLTSAKGVSRVKKGRYALRGVALVLVLVLVTLFTPVSRKKPFQALNDKNQVGDIIPFGSTEGKPLFWRVIDRDGDTLQLFALRPVTYAAFSHPHEEGDENRTQYGSNFWPDSPLREWLNGDFMVCFSKDEKRLIVENAHQVILSFADKEKATAGEKEFFWTHVPSQAAFGLESAYRLTVTDRVMLLDVAQYAALYQKGLERHAPWEYWLETPYYNNSSMVRIVNREGYVLMKDAAYEKMGVRPSIRISLSRLEEPLEAENDL